VATVTFPIPATPVAAGTTTLPFSDITSQVAGHTTCAVHLDLTAWTSTDHIAGGLTFRIDSATVVAGPQFTTTGGVHLGMDGVTPMLPGCGGPLPVFTTRLEASADLTVPSAGSVSGSVSLS
jgi:hypothetical protein